jgi:ribose transport system permease protein
MTTREQPAPPGAAPSDAPPTDTTGLVGWRAALGQRSVRTVLAVYGFLVVLFFASKLVNSSFGSVSFLRTVAVTATFAAIAGFGQFVVVLTGGLDLSLPSVISLSGVLFTGLSNGENGNIAWALPLVCALGTAIGVVNGVGVTYLRLAPVVMTLAVGVILSGVVLVYTNGTPKGGTPPAVIRVMQGSAGGLPNVVIILLVATALATLLMNKTVFGRNLYALGSNRRVAYLSGLRVNALTISAYALSGLTAAITGVMLDGYGNQSYLGMGDPYLLLTLAAVVVGGVSILGGRGLYIGVVGGALILQTISTTLSGTALPEAVKQIVYAVVIIAAVLAARQTTT